MLNVFAPKISLIIPIYKTEDVVGRCLDSLKRQTFQDFEIIIINDCTPDGAMNVVNDYANTNTPIKIVEHTENKGPMIARQEGVKIASGKYFIFLDSDDTLPEDALETLYKEIKTSGADIVISGFQYVWENQNRGEKHYPKSIGEFTPTEVFYKLLDGSLTHNLAFSIFKSDLFKHEYITIPNQTNGEDLILFYQLVANSKKIKSVNYITYNYHQDGTSSTRSPMSPNKLRQLVRVQNFIYQFLFKYGINEKLIFQSIVPLVIRRFRYPEGNIAAKDLDSRILKEISILRSYSYLSLKEWIIYVVVKKTWICSYIIRYIYSHHS